MKRDCGKGELIPVAFIVRISTGKNDTETRTKFASLAEAIGAFDKALGSIKEPHSAVALYAKDRAGYENCILSAFWSDSEEAKVTNRLNELE